jgi:hypothetical protein
MGFGTTLGFAGGGLTMRTNFTAVSLTRLMTKSRASPTGPLRGTVRKAATWMAMEAKIARLKPRRLNMTPYPRPT